MLEGCNELISLILSNYSTSKFTIMSFLLLRSANLKYINIRNFKTNNICKKEKIFKQIYKKLKSL